jgi:hypothetical protein
MSIITKIGETVRENAGGKISDTIVSLVKSSGTTAKLINTHIFAAILFSKVPLAINFSQRYIRPIFLNFCESM